MILRDSLIQSKKTPDFKHKKLEKQSSVAPSVEQSEQSSYFIDCSAWEAMLARETESHSRTLARVEKCEKSATLYLTDETIKKEGFN